MIGLAPYISLALAYGLSVNALPSNLEARATSVTPESFAATQFDVIIVGGGTAGLVVANRLSAKSLKVGVIEAGGYNPAGDPLIDVPYNGGYFVGDPSASVIFNPAYDWSFASIPQPALNGTVIGYPRGKVLGGSSASNFMLWQRGQKSEYDTWNTVFGNGDGWSFSSLLSYMNRAETWSSPATGKSSLINSTTSTASLAASNGKNGPVAASYGIYRTDLDAPLTRASATLGFPLNSNPDGGSSTYLPEFGVANSIDPVSRNRSYAVTAYYKPVASRSNLQVLTGALATKLVWKSSTLNSSAVTASGVQFTVGGKTYTVNAAKEVILSAGSLKTPQLLELSGVGNPTLLKSLGIPVVVNASGVGENLMDHPISTSDFIVKDGVLTLDKLRNNASYAAEQASLFQKSHSGAFTYASTVTGSFPLKKVLPDATYKSMRTQLDSDLSKMTLSPLQKAQYTVVKSLLDDGVTGGIAPGLLPYGGRASTAAANTSYMTIASYQLHGFSRGTVHISSADPTVAPTIDPKLLSVPWDLQVQIVAAQFIRKLAQTAPLSDLIASINTPPASVTTNDQWAAYLKGQVQSMGHPMGTTVMASKSLGGVVDPSLKVYGLANVRIVDAGVIPLTVGYPIQETVYGIAEKGAEMIAQDLGVA